SSSRLSRAGGIIPTTVTLPGRFSDMLRPGLIGVTLVLFLGLTPVRAELQRLEIVGREAYAGGKAFGEAGPYEMLTGIAHFAVDPKHPRNAGIVDLALAPVNKEGLVEFQADFYILAPKDPRKGNGAVLYDVNNRGNKLALGTFGDGFLLGRGFTVVGCG